MKETNTPKDVRITDRELAGAAEVLAAACLERGLYVATAESCTGGWIAKCLTDLPGSSGWFREGVVTYSNSAKRAMLAVDPATLERDGAVSQAVVEAMAAGMQTRWAKGAATVAVSGVAGPGGGSADKPVGLVWLAWCAPDGMTRSEVHVFPGDREMVRRRTVLQAVRGLTQTIADYPERQETPNPRV